MKLCCCPICGSAPYITKDPLWEGTRGYVGSYNIKIKCSNDECVLSKNALSHSTMGEGELFAVDSVKEAWNNQFTTITKQLEWRNEIK